MAKVKKITKAKIEKKEIENEEVETEVEETEDEVDDKVMTTKNKGKKTDKDDCPKTTWDRTIKVECIQNRWSFNLGKKYAITKRVYEKYQTCLKKI